MMNRKSLIGALVGLLLLTGIIGANLVMAGGRQDAGKSVQSEEATSTDDDNLECPAQGLPACEGQMNDEKGEGPENEADEANEKGEGPENEADEANEKGKGPENEADEANEKGEGPENEADEANENDSHEDAEGADHQCPPDCDTANGEEG